MNVLLTVLKSGGDFTPQHAAAIERMAYDNCMEPHRFCCLTDMQPEDDGVSRFIEWLPLVSDAPGWWAKVEMFRPGLFGERDRVLYVDLDTILFPGFEKLWGAIDTDLLLLRDFYHPATGNTGIVGFHGGHDFGIWERFNPAKISPRRPDAGYINTTRPVRYWQDEFPGKVVSYKVHCNGKLPGGQAVVCFHGKPRPWEVEDEWAKKWY